MLRFMYLNLARGTMDNNIKGFEMMRLLTLEAKTERKKID